MPANRSRTHRWKDSLRQIHERGGGIEFAVNTDDGSGINTGSTGNNAPAIEPSPDLVWRVRLLELSETDMVLEMPSAAGRTVTIAPGSAIVGMLTVGQNRWMFNSRIVEHVRVQGYNARHCPIGLRIEMPEVVERCVRRHFYRISTASLSLPNVECYTLLDPMSVAPAEIANRAQILDLYDDDLIGQGVAANPPMLLPEVGPAFPAKLANISGGGVGLRIDRDAAQQIDSTRLFWMRIDLRPSIPAPLAVTARLAHQHMDATQDVYAGMAFDFTFNTPHREFVTNELLRYVERFKKAA